MTLAARFRVMPTAVVTGGRGFAGSRVVERLADDGWEVVCVDLGLPDAGGPEGVSFRAGDLTDQGVAWELVADADPDAVVHFAAIPTDASHAGTHVFETNVTSAYNVLTAAGRAGARTVWASSVTAHGLYDQEATLPDALPVDETAPLVPRRPYPTSKAVGEEIAGRTARRYGVSVASIRPTLVVAEGGERTRRDRLQVEPLAGPPGALAALGDDERGPDRRGDGLAGVGLWLLRRRPGPGSARGGRARRRLRGPRGLPRGGARELPRRLHRRGRAGSLWPPPRAV
jgi:nucleoside-diphosphate-sugar epimerase